MDYTGFKREILVLTGIDLGAYKENQMKRRIEAFIKKNNCLNYEEYIQFIRRDKQELENFLSYMTINVSEFFRNPMQWQTLEKEILPLIVDSYKPIKIWSAACSTGDEPYSLAMLLSKYVPLSRIQIIATDIDKDILQKAREGIYVDRHLTNVPTEFKNKYFVQEENTYKISDDIKKCITFKQHNLLKDSYLKDIDLIVCRNVLIYFTEESKKEIYTKFSQSLSKEGILFVGSTEQIIGANQYNLYPYKFFFYKTTVSQD